MICIKKNANIRAVNLCNIRKCFSSGVYKAGKTTVNLTLEGTKKEDGTTENTKINTWLSGTHYTYTIVFKANEILVAPSYGTWATADQSVTVE